MKKTISILMALAALILMAAPAMAQTTSNVIPQPDCIVFFHFTAVNQHAPTSPNNGLDNRTQGCTAWSLAAASSGFTAFTVALQSAPNSAGTPGTYVTYLNQNVSAGANPVVGASAGAAGYAWLSGYNPWVRVQVTAVTGTTGVIDGALFGWRNPSASKGGGISGGPFTAGDVIVGGGGQAIADSSQPLSGLAVNPMTAVGDMISGGASPAGSPGRVPGNISPAPKVLTETGDGVNAGTPIWSVITNGASLYYATNTASDVAGALQYTTATYSPKTTLGPYAVISGTASLQEWVTNAGVPGASFAPAGAWVVHIHYSRSPAPIGTIQLQAVIEEVSSTGVFIATIGTTELSPAINPQGGEQETDLAYADSSPYTFASTASRVAVVIQAVSSSATPTVSLYVGGTADAHLSLPSSGSNVFVPYSGATSDLNLGTHSETVQNITINGTCSGPGCGGGVAPPITFADIATPMAPSAGNTAWYTKGGKLCSLSPASVEACTGSGGGGGGPTAYADVSASRTMLTGVYQNTGTTALWWTLSVFCNVGYASALYQGASNPPTTVYAVIESYNENMWSSATIPVLPGNYYKAGGDCNPSPGNYYWIEAK